MNLTSQLFCHLDPVPPPCAFGRTHPTEPMQLSDNKNPDLAWDGVPPGTRSFVLLCHDPDSPTQAELVNRPDIQIPENAPRGDFYHWVLVDLGGGVRGIDSGEFSAGIAVGGKPGPSAPRSTRQGLNSFTLAFSGDPSMRGKYFGYDGPCPPWNDERRHRYVFTLYALDVDRCPVEGEFSAAEVLAAIQGHVLAQATLTATYSLKRVVA